MSSFKLPGSVCSVVIFCILSYTIGSSYAVEESVPSRATQFNSLADNQQRLLPEKRAYTYSEYKRFPLFSFGIGKV